MSKRFQCYVLYPMVVVAIGCSPSDPKVDGNAPTTTSPDGAVEMTAVEAVNGSTTVAPDVAPDVDPDIDAGMLADELERSERLNPSPVEDPGVDLTPVQELKE